MVVSPMARQRLSARDDNGVQGINWRPIQIAAPVIVGGGLLLAFAAYIIWKRRRSRSYDYHPVRTDWVTKMFNPRRTPRRVVPTPTTSNRRLDSTDSQTPLTQTYPSDFPSVPRLPHSPPPMAKRPAVRWWWFFGSRPQEIKSEAPGSRWHVDAPDGSSTGHGHTNHEEYHRYVGSLETTHEEPVEDGGIGAIPARPVREMSSLPNRSGSLVARTPVPMVVVLPRGNDSATQVPSGDRGLPPSYDVSHAHTLVRSVKETARLLPSEPHMVFPPALRPAGHSSPRVFDGRELSSESFLRAQSPMIATH